MSNAKTKQKWSFKTVLFFSLTVLAFIASAAALFEMAVLSGWSLWIAGILPLIIDGAIVLTIMDMVETRRKGGKAGWAMFVFIFCSVVSTLLNGYHSYVSEVDGGVPTEIRVMIGVLPPVLLLMLTKQFEGSIERDAAVDVLTEAPAPAEPLVTEVGEALAIAEAKPAAAAVEHVEHVEAVAIEAPAPEPVLANSIAAPAPVAETIDSDDAAADDQIDTVDTEIDTAIDSGNAVDDKADSAGRLAIVSDLEPAEVIPDEPDGQVEWILSQVRAGVDLSSWKTLAQLFSDGGRPLGDRTVQRRLAAAREQAPEAFAA